MSAYNPSKPGKSSRVYHNSWQTLYRAPFGAVEEGTSVTLRLAVRKSRRPVTVALRLWRDQQEIIVPMEPAGQIGFALLYEITMVPRETPGLLWYYFILTQDKKTWYYCNNEEILGGEGKLYPSPFDSFQITVYKKGYHVPSWLSQGTMYQIFVDRFYRPGEGIEKEGAEYYYHSQWGEAPRIDLTDRYGDYSNRDFFGGNLYGVIEKLPYLAELGITVLYLNPIFDAFSNHKYDTGDYEQVDVMFGGNDAFETLCRQAKTYGIRIVLDGVFNHTGSNSKYFNKEGAYPSLGAFQSKESPYYSWYRFGQWPEHYDSWWGIQTLPAVNEEEPSALEYLVTGQDSIVRRWLSAGASGWRLDVADELPESFLKALYKAVKEENPEAAVIGEVWEDASRKESYGHLREYLLGEEMDSVMNYPFADNVLSFFTEEISSHTFLRRLKSLEENYPAPVFYSLMNSLGTHDVPRVLTRLGGAPDFRSVPREQQAEFTLFAEERILAKQRLKLASLIQYTFPGIPSLYYGDEAGMEGMGDPFNRRCYPWGEEDQEILQWYRWLGTLRRERLVIQRGQYTPCSTPKSVLSYLRHCKGGKDCFGQPAPEEYLLVAVNATASAVNFTVDCSEFPFQTLRSLTDDTVIQGDGGGFSITLSPRGYLVLEGVK